MSLNPDYTYALLLAVQAFHLLHHRVAKRHISYAEVVSGFVLCIPPSAPMPPAVFVTVHLMLAIIQVSGSIWIRRLSPAWDAQTRT